MPCSSDKHSELNKSHPLAIPRPCPGLLDLILQCLLLPPRRVTKGLKRSSLSKRTMHKKINSSWDSKQHFFRSPISFNNGPGCNFEAEFMSRCSDHCGISATCAAMPCTAISRETFRLSVLSIQSPNLQRKAARLLVLASQITPYTHVWLWRRIHLHEQATTRALALRRMNVLHAARRCARSLQPHLQHQRRPAQQGGERERNITSLPAT